MDNGCGNCIKCVSGFVINKRIDVAFVNRRIHRVIDVHEPIGFKCLNVKACTDAEYRTTDHRERNGIRGHKTVFAGNGAFDNFRTNQLINKFNIKIVGRFNILIAYAINHTLAKHS